MNMSLKSVSSSVEGIGAGAAKLKHLLLDEPGGSSGVNEPGGSSGI